jgi:hypothetical protein
VELAPLGIGDGPERAEGAGDVDHHRVVGLAQQRQCGLGDTDDTDRVGVEYLQRDRAVDVRCSTDAGVVDEDVQVALAFVDHAHGGLHGRVVGHVELHEPGAELGRGRLSSLDAARPDVDGVPLGDQSAGGLVAESLVGPGDERHGHVWCSLGSCRIVSPTPYHPTCKAARTGSAPWTHVRGLQGARRRKLRGFLPRVNTGGLGVSGYTP